jgi:hypothetical protein
LRRGAVPGMAGTAPIPPAAIPRPRPMARAFTDTILAALPDILNPDRDGYHDTNPDAAAIIGDLARPLERAQKRAWHAARDLGLRWQVTWNFASRR